MTSRILAIDTTAEFGSLSLGGEEVLLHAPDGFGGLIFDHIGRLLHQFNAGVADLDGFAAASGPGSFTGVRIGLACVKGLAEATGKPAFGVSNLAALARFGSAEIRVPVIDARRGEVYAGIYDAHGNAVGPEMVCPFKTLLARLPEERVEFVSHDFAPFACALMGTPFAECAVTNAPRALAAIIGRIAQELAEAGDKGDPVSLDANYVRRSDAELLFKPW